MCFKKIYPHVLIIVYSVKQQMSQLELILRVITDNNNTNSSLELQVRVFGPSDYGRYRLPCVCPMVWLVCTGFYIKSTFTFLEHMIDPRAGCDTNTQNTMLLHS